MDQAIFLVLDFDKSCRLCLQPKGSMSDIFEIFEDTIPLVDQIEQTTGVIITEYENLPKKICHKCRYTVELSFELRETVVRSNHLLNETVDHDTLPETEKLETDETKTHRESANTMDTEAHDKLTNDEVSNDSDILDSMKVECDETEESNSADFLAIKVEKDIDTCFEADWSPGRDEISDKPITRTSNHKKSSQRKNKIKPTPKYLTCLVCLKVFDSRAAVFQHAVSSHYQGTGLTPYMIAKKPFTCNLCSSTNLTRRDLLLHHLTHLDVSPFVCEAPNCGYRAKSKDKLRHHSYSHGERKFICETCGTAFRRKFELMQHAMRHADEGSTFPCRLCRVVCRNRLSFKAHLRYHELGRRFKCPKPGCPKGFYSRNDLQVHLRAHNNERLFRCHMCVSSYVSQSQLNRHLRQHDKQRVSKCDKCSSTFNNYAQFYNHRVVTHGPWQPHKCRGCNQGYQSIGQLENHMGRCRLAQNVQSLENEGYTDNIGNNNEDGNSNEGIGNSNEGIGNSNDGIGSSNDGIGNSNNGIGSSNHGIGNSNYDIDISSYGMSDTNNENNGNDNISKSNDGIVSLNNGINAIGSFNDKLDSSNGGIGSSNNKMVNSNDEIVSLDLEEFLGQRFRRTVTGPVLVKPSMLKNGKINIQEDQLPADSLLYIEVDNEEDVDDPGSRPYAFVELSKS